MNPCIRNLPSFKKGCPENDSCPCWIEKTAVTSGGEHINHKMCLDLWMFKLGWDANCLAEGQQIAIETFRNNTFDAGRKVAEAVQIAGEKQGLIPL